MITLVEIADALIAVSVAVVVGYLIGIAVGLLLARIAATQSEASRRRRAF